MSTCRVLFVDDEPALLGLLRMLFSRLADDWEVVFADRGEGALRAMEGPTIDLVVSDMRMPGMSGLELLTVVRERYPQTARMILSGFSDQATVFKSLGVAHQFVTKPFDLRALQNTVRRLVSMRDMLGNARLREVEARIQSLPSLPELYSDLMEELGVEGATIESVADLISLDVSLTAKLLQLVNSAFFGVAQEVTTARQAVQILGFSLVRALALSIFVFSRFDSATMPRFPIDRLWRHSLATGMTARRIALERKAAPAITEAAFTAGILHDIGAVALNLGLPQLHRTARERADRQGWPLEQAEMDTLGAAHPEVGAFLLGLWGLPPEIVEAVAWHHQPRLGETKAFTALTAVHAAEFLQTKKTPVWDPQPSAAVDLEYLRGLGLEGDLDRWVSEES